MSNLSVKHARSGEPIKVHQTIILWFAVSIAWFAIMRVLGRGIPNYVYLQWGGIAISMVILSKWLMRQENSTFAQFMGRELSKRWVGELAIVSIASVMIGIASWGTLVYFSATIDVEWAYRHWQVGTKEAFQEISWIPSWLVMHFISAVILVPIIEEIVFRGLILRRLRYKYGLRYSIMVSSLLFALIHFDKNFLGMFFFGAVLAVVTIRFKSLYAAIFVHGTYNASVFALQRGFGVGFVADKSQLDSIGYWLPEFCIMALGIVAVSAYIRLGLRMATSESVFV